MQKSGKIFFLWLLIIIGLMGCRSDEIETIVEEPNVVTRLEEQRNITTQSLVNGNGQTWKITKAQLTNSSGVIDISNNFNVIDDEFKFSGNSNALALQWRIGEDINYQGINSKETLLDYYLSPKDYDLSFIENNGNGITSRDKNFTFTILDNNSINAELNFPDENTSLNLTLTPKTLVDYAKPRTGDIAFEESFTFKSSGIYLYAPGMIGSDSDNSLFIATREDAANNGDNSPERIIKYSFENEKMSDHLYYNSDWVSKQLHIINNQLIVIGGKYVNTYNLDIETDPISVPHGKSFTRFGMSVQNDKAYITGGEFIPIGDNDIDIINANKIYAWDINNQSLSEVIELPETRFWARSAIINNKIYVFGGIKHLVGFEEPQNTIYIADLNNNNIETIEMDRAIDVTYVDKYFNLIYIAGTIDLLGLTTTPVLGVFDTRTNQYQELSHNLDLKPHSAIHGMCVFNDKIHVIYGDAKIDDIGQELEWSVMSADIK